MNTEKEYKEMKENSFMWKTLSIILFIALVCVGVADNYYDKKTETQLEECKYNLRQFNWNNDTLDFCYECEDTKGCWGFNDHGDYVNAINVLKDLNCEVVLDEN